MKWMYTSQRKEYANALTEVGKERTDVVVLDADLSSSTRTAEFAKNFPERFFNCGIAEQNMIGTAAGLAAAGKTVFASTFAAFATGRCWDQIRQAVAYSNLDVKIVATHAFAYLDYHNICFLLAFYLPLYPDYPLIFFYPFELHSLYQIIRFD